MASTNSEVQIVLARWIGSRLSKYTGVIAAPKPSEKIATRMKLTSVAMEATP